jgi:hypothetical protein
VNAYSLRYTTPDHHIYINNLPKAYVQDDATVYQVLATVLAGLDRGPVADVLVKEVQGDDVTLGVYHKSTGLFLVREIPCTD